MFGGVLGKLVTYLLVKNEKNNPLGEKNKNFDYREEQDLKEDISFSCL